MGTSSSIILKDDICPVSTLVAKGPDAESRYFRLMWRRRQCPLGFEKRLLTELGVFWELKAEIALCLLQHAEACGLLSSQRDRWPISNYTVLDSDCISDDRRDWLLRHVLTVGECGELRVSSTDMRIVAHREPTGWWRVVLIDRSTRAVSFRTVKEPNVGADLVGFRAANDWEIYPILMDANTAVHRVHLSILRQEKT